MSRVVEIKEILDERNWNPQRIISDIPLQQAFWYGEMQKNRGRIVRRFELSENAVPKAYMQIIEYPLLFGMMYWYAPYGPVIKDADQNVFQVIKEHFLKDMKASQSVFVRLDFSPALSPELEKHAKKVFKTASRSSSTGSYYQPRYEWTTDITKTENEILYAMHQKTRYSVRYAEKKGIKAKIISGEQLYTRLPDFISLLKNTAKRNRFSLHDESYYRCFFDEVSKRNIGFLVEASLRNEILASHLVVIEGSIAHFVFGGSGDSKKELCAPYLAHFEGMKEAKRRGASKYNFGGVSVNESAPHWEGVTTFKKKFGGRLSAHSRYFDIVLRSFWYNLYNFRKFFKSLL